MKKIFAIAVAVAMSLSAMAQEHGFYGNRFTDNWYIGLNGGVGAHTKTPKMMSNLNFDLGLRFGKWLSPSIGMAIEATGMFTNKSNGVKVSNGTPAFSQIGILATVNLTNAIKSYYGEPRKFEVILAPGFLWGHNYGDNVPGTVLNSFINKLAVDVCYNFGKKKEWQAYIEPSLNYLIGGIDDGYEEEGVNKNLVYYNINQSFLMLNVGITYKFKTSNGTHNFALVESCNDEEIDNINDLINQLRAADEESDEKITSVEKENTKIEQDIDACASTPQVEEKIRVPDLPTVFYQVNKSNITPAQEQNVAVAAEVLKNHPEYKLHIKGYASPEGGHSNNMSLGVRRANAVKDMLVSKYGIKADRIVAEGCDPTDELFPVYEFNRVAVMLLEK